MKFLKSDGIQNGVLSLPKLIELHDTITVDAGSDGILNLVVGYNKYEIRTIKAVCAANIDVKVLENISSNVPIYTSLQDTVIYDILGLPCTDKDDTKALHLKIHNYGLSPALVDVTAKVTEMQ